MWVPGAALCQAKSGQTRVAFKEKAINDRAMCARSCIPLIREQQRIHL